MRDTFKALLILAGIFIVLGLFSLSDNERSFAHPPLNEATPMVARPYSPAIKASGAYSLYLPIVRKPPAPIYLPIVFKPATPTPTPTATPTSTRIPNPIQNPGFEQPNDASGPWWATRQHYPDGPLEGIDVRVDRGGLPTGVSPHGGDWVSWLGGIQDYAMFLQQDVTIPAGGATLRYWTWIQSDEPSCDPPYDEAWVFFKPPNQQYQVEHYALCWGSVTSGWVKRDVDLSSYVGQSGSLTFAVRILGENSNLFIDDVALGTLTSSPSRGETFVPVRVATPVR
jgi:hypothetical protein